MTEKHVVYHSEPMQVQFMRLLQYNLINYVYIKFFALICILFILLCTTFYISLVSKAKIKD